jgi:hypothetical protein
MARMMTTPTPPAARFLLGTFGFVFAGIGLTVLGFLWTADGFGEPPLVFKLFGSLIAVAFVAFGGTMAFGAIRGTASGAAAAGGRMPAPTAGGYACPKCGAALGARADVSPLGDAKCAFCGAWFNVHGQAAS